MKKKIIMLLLIVLGSIAMVRESLAEKTEEVQEKTTVNPSDDSSEAGTQSATDNNNSESPETEKDPSAAPKAEDTGTAPVTQTDDVSDGSKFKTYNSYENAVLAKKNASSIYQLSQLYFKDGLYERAVNLAKKDVSGDIRNLFVGFSL